MAEPLTDQAMEVIDSDNTVDDVRIYEDLIM
jgi:hypothetical protein